MKLWSSASGSATMPPSANCCWSPLTRRTRLSGVALLFLFVTSMLIATRQVAAGPHSEDSRMMFDSAAEDDDDDGVGDLNWPTLTLSPGYRAAYGPYFDPIFPTNISVLAGQTVLLQCRIIDLADRVVSWVRQSDLAILASGGVSHTSDGRITASADESLSDWELRITEAQTKDSGVYECQVNTEPKINWPVTVHVEAAVATIVGAAELYVRTGSTISLTCIIQGSGAIPPRVLFWFHDGQPIALDSPRGGISLETERTPAGMSSKLLLTRAILQDGGNYTCAPPGAQPAEITVHVLNGEHPAAMQRGNRSPSGINGGLSPNHFGAKFIWISQIIGLQYFLHRLSIGVFTPVSL